MQLHPCNTQPIRRSIGENPEQEIIRINIDVLVNENIIIVVLMQDVIVSKGWLRTSESRSSTKSKTG